MAGLPSVLSESVALILNTEGLPGDLKQNPR